jgi:hypothetical protein
LPPPPQLRLPQLSRFSKAGNRYPEIKALPPANI